MVHCNHIVHYVATGGINGNVAIMVVHLVFNLLAVIYVSYHPNLFISNLVGCIDLEISPWLVIDIFTGATLGFATYVVTNRISMMSFY